MSARFPQGFNRRTAFGVPIKGGEHAIGFNSWRGLAVAFDRQCNRFRATGAWQELPHGAAMPLGKFQENLRVGEGLPLVPRAIRQKHQRTRRMFQITKPAFRVFLLLAVAVVLHARAAAADVADQTAIATLLHGTFDRKDAQLTIAPIVVVGDYAIAGWTQGEMGGRALLRKKAQQWSLILCAGDKIKSARSLMTAGVSGPDASALERDLAAAESAMSKQQTAMFSRFQGITMMGGSDNDRTDHRHDASH